MRRDHRSAIALFETELERLQRAQKHRALLLETARGLLDLVPRRPLAEIVRGDVERYLAACVASGCRPSTPARRGSALRVFFTMLVKHEMLAGSPLEGFRISEPSSAAPVVLSEGSVRKLLDATLEEPPISRQRRPRWTRAVALRDRALLELLYAIGLRDAEARRALVVDLDVDDASILVRAVKRGRWRRVPVPPRTLDAIGHYLAKSRPLFVRGRPDPGHLILTMRGQPLSQGCAYQAVTRAAQRAGIRAHPHAFRRAIATHLMRAQVPVVAVQNLLGHRSIETTATYLEVDRDELHRTVELLERPLVSGDEGRLEGTHFAAPSEAPSSEAKPTVVRERPVE